VDLARPSGGAVHEDEEDDHPGGRDGEGERCDELAHGSDFP
jgi:hypothetical protein